MLPPGKSCAVAHGKVAEKALLWASRVKSVAERHPDLPWQLRPTERANGRFEEDGVGNLLGDAVSFGSFPLAVNRDLHSRLCCRRMSCPGDCTVCCRKVLGKGTPVGVIAGGKRVVSVRVDRFGISEAVFMS